VGQLRNLEMIRERCGKVMALAQAGKTKHFALDETKLPAVVDFVLETTKKNYPKLDVPYHSRWRHFRDGEVDELRKNWTCDELEKVRRMIDLATVSVLLDAGAGDAWKYNDAHGKVTSRSEGLALASMDMFCDGAFSSDVAIPHRVNAHGIKQLTMAQFCKGFQVNEKTNPLLGVKTRFEMMQRVADALLAHPEFFGTEVCRPGHMLDYVLKHTTDKKVSLRVLWKAVIEGFESIWGGKSGGSAVQKGDVWVYTPLKVFGTTGSDLVPFHKLSQWLTYSLLEPIELLGIKFQDMDLMTGLAEYRNGGLFVDMGVLTLRDTTITAEREFDAGAELLVEWRALTVCLLDKVGEAARKKLKLSAEEFPLAKILQGGTWAAGRIIAAKKRKGKGPPINVRSTGTVF
jgi:hypothetical protein